MTMGFGGVVALIRIISNTPPSPGLSSQGTA
jgi:hypothetical protein